MGIRPRNLVTEPIKPGSKMGTIEFCEKIFTPNAQFDFDLKLCAFGVAAQKPNKTNDKKNNNKKEKNK